MATNGFRGAVIYDDPREVDARLVELGLTHQELRDALEAGLAAAALTTANHPPNFGGRVYGRIGARLARDAHPEGMAPRQLV
jgi:hypothetical protein